MGKNVTVYISEELARKMKEFGEVNWSEIARHGIEGYIEGRATEVVIKNQVPSVIVNELLFYVEFIGEHMDASYVYSIASMYNDFPNALVTNRERSQFFNIFNLLGEDYSDLMQSFKSLEQRRSIEEFEPVFVKLIRIIGRYSTMVQDFVSLVQEKTDRIELIGQRPRSGSANYYLDKTYANFRDRYNMFVMNFAKFGKVTFDLHKRCLDNYRVYQLLAPRLVDFRLSVEKEKT